MGCRCDLRTKVKWSDPLLLSRLNARNRWCFRATCPLIFAMLWTSILISIIIQVVKISQIQSTLQRYARLFIVLLTIICYNIIEYKRNYYMPNDWNWNLVQLSLVPFCHSKPNYAHAHLCVIHRNYTCRGLRVSMIASASFLGSNFSIINLYLYYNVFQNRWTVFRMEVSLSTQTYR